MSAQSYVVIGENILLQELAAFCQNTHRRWVIVTDSHLESSLGKFLKDALNVPLFSFPAGENYKTRETKHGLEDTLLQNNYGRDTGLIALGGGVVTDLVGFLAATYCRGIPVIYVPTTLLAMVDASIGGKTGVDTVYGKNLIGAFYPPQGVFMDTTTLKSLPEKEWQNGIVETLKHGLIAKVSLVDLLKTNIHSFREPQMLLEIVKQSVAIKQTIVNQDEHDHGIRQLLNFGHTIGHAIESVENYERSHGEAVAIGLVVEAYLSVLGGFLDKAVVSEIEEMLRGYGLPLKTSSFEDLSLLKQAMQLDKKSKKNVPHFVALKAIGETYQIHNQYAFPVKEEWLEEALRWARERFGI